MKQRAVVAFGIEQRKPFVAGAMRGVRVRPGDLWPTGKLADPDLAVYRAQAVAIDFVVFSYDTVIAWHRPGAWHVAEQRFSQTTSRHQNLVRDALDWLDRRGVAV